jgi:hypothetical protein
MSDMMSGSESVAMSLADHSRRFDRLSFTSGLPRSTDIAGPFPLVRLAPTCDIEMPVVPVLTIEKGGGFLFSALLRMGRLMICPTGKSVACVSSPLCKNISLNPTGKSLLQLRAVPPERGALAIVTNVGRDAVDAKAPKDERRLCPAKPFGRRRVMRTAKSCGPDASTLASSWHRRCRP